MVKSHIWGAESPEGSAI